MKTISQKLPAALILIAAIVLMQSHAITWWSQHDPATGWLWAITIEAGAVWLWSRRSAITTGVAIIATALALVAPLADLAGPVLDEQRTSAQAADTLPQRTATAEARIATLEASLAQYQANSQYRSGWHSLIVGTEQQLSAARADLADLQTEQRTPAPETLAVWLPLIMQMAAVCMLQILIVTCTRSLTRPVTERPVPASDQAPDETTDDQQLSLWAAAAQIATAQVKNAATRAGQRGAA